VVDETKVKLLREAYERRSTLTCIHYACGDFIQSNGVPVPIYCVALVNPSDPDPRVAL
jgi:hypothetical protein